MADSIQINFQKLGRSTNNVTSFSIDSGYMTSTDGFEFELYEEDRELMRGLELEPVEILVNGNSQLLGRIEVTTIGGNGSAVKCSGRDYISDIVECNVDPTLIIKKEMTLETALLFACGPVGIDGIVGEAEFTLRNIRTGRNIPGVPALEFHNLKMEEVKPKANEGIYEFCNRLIARFGGTIQPANERSTLLIEAPNYSQEPAYRIVRSSSSPQSTANNVLEATCTRDYSTFPTYVLFLAKGANPGKPKKDIKQIWDMGELAVEFNDEISSILEGKIVKGRRRPEESPIPNKGEVYRLLYFRDEDSKNATQVERAARRALSERLKDCLQYEVTLRGHSDPETGAVWSTNTIVEVHDDVCGVNERLWIEGRTLSYDGSGPTTRLTCWRPSSFII